MPTVTLSRSDVFPIGTTVGIYPPGSAQFGGPPGAAVIASAVVDAAGLLTVTNAGILQGVTYVAYANVSGEHRYVQARSTLDVADVGRAAGSGTTTNGSPLVTGLTATSGAFATGQRLATTTANGALPPHVRIQAMSSIASGAVTAAAATDLFTKTGHGLRVGDPVTFTGLTGGAGITAGAAYYVILVPDANTFKVSAVPGGPSIDVTTDLTVGTLNPVAVLDTLALASGAQSLVAEGASPPAVVLGQTPRTGPPSKWRAQVRQRRQLAGTS
jgi:hypothetical protein